MDGRGGQMYDRRCVKWANTCPRCCGEPVAALLPANAPRLERMILRADAGSVIVLVGPHAGLLAE
jgi:hypothetical protein